MLTAELQVTHEQILAEDCPTCDAPPGADCISTHFRYPGPGDTPYAHPMRRFAAQKTRAEIIAEEGKRLRRLEHAQLERVLIEARAEALKFMGEETGTEHEHDLALEALIEAATKLARHIV